MKIAIVGSRGLDPDLSALLGAPAAGTIIVSGGAAGVDQAAERYAREHGCPLEVLRPDYARHGRRAPLVRNVAIVERADKIVTVWDGKSRGTAYTIAQARKLGKPVTILTP